MRWLPVCVVLCVTGTLGARILVILPFPSESLKTFSHSVLRALTDRGHQVVEYSPHPPDKPRANHTHVEIHSAFEDTLKQWTYQDIIRLTDNKPVVPVGFKPVWNMLYPICEETFEDASIKKLLNSNEHFDLVVTESTFGQESMLVFGHKFRAPTVALQVINLWSAVNHAAGNALSIASNPDLRSLIADDDMTFGERTVNFMSTIMTLYQFYNVHLPIHQQIVNKHYPGEPPCLVELVTDVSLYIINAHPAVEYPRPYSPNIVPVAGISQEEGRTPLPWDIQKFMDDAKEGVIYFSFGTVVPLHTFPERILQIFLKVFKKISFKVIWKIELEDIPDLPSNVILRKWLPQPGILAHPNLRVFLTHGGVNSQLEAIHAGVPTVGIPFFGDQPYNVRLTEHHDIGVKVDFKTLSEETLLYALTKVLNDRRYKENAQRMSRIFRDRPVSPADSVVFWTEYVLRHGRARHLQPAAARLAWYQLWLLDVAAVVILALLVSTVTMYIVIRKILSIMCGYSNSISTSKKEN